MKIFFIIFALFLLNGCASNSTQEQIVVHSRAGIVGSLGCESEGFHGGHLAERQSCDDLVVIDEVSKIKMKTEIDFGVEYLITPSTVKSCFKETRFLEHPPMLQPDGRVTTRYSRSYYIGECDSDHSEAISFGRDVFSWYIEKDWEAVVGEWVFKILIDDEVVINHKLTLY